MVPQSLSPGTTAAGTPARGSSSPHAFAVVRIFRWLGAGFGDLWRAPGFGLLYGLAFAALSWLVIGLLWILGLEWMLLPAISGALMVGPVVAAGLYRHSARRMDPKARVPASPGQIALLGGVLMVLLLTWFRAATILYALIFGLKAHHGFVELLRTLAFTPDGWTLLAVGSVVGGLFAALTFAISIYSIPMLVHRDMDAFTAMGRSFSAATHNFGLTVCWGIAVTALAGIGFATGMIGMIVIFPWLGFATWHAYCDVFETELGTGRRGKGRGRS